MLKQFCGMVVVCHKYRHGPAPNISPPGIDIIALMPQVGGRERIVYAETKLRTNADGGVLTKALAQLAKERSSADDKPMSLKSTLQGLHDTDRPLCDRVLEATGSGAPKPHYRIGAIFEAKHWSNHHLDRLEGSQNARGIDIAIDVVKINDLDGLIKESYDMVVGTNA